MRLKLALIAALAGSAFIPMASSTPASARTVLLQPSAPVAAAGWHRPAYRHGWNRRYYPRRHYGYGSALGGFAAGAIIGSALAAPRAPAYYYPGPDSETVAYCARRFKSYDPASGTYLGYDGYRHPCP